MIKLNGVTKTSQRQSDSICERI